MVLIIVVLVVLIVLLIDKSDQYKKLLEENRKLREMLSKERNKSNSKMEIKEEQVAKKEIDNMEQTLEQYLKEQQKQQEALSKQNEKEREKEEEKKEEKENINEKERKNIFILVTGAICIVLSAIVFLMSTWNSIHNILKTVVLALLTLVFFGGSYIAKEKFKLKKASQTFFYIAMAYIPICLLSISIFRLFGTYLSIYGEGRYIYFMIASIFVAFIYYGIYVKQNNRYLLYGSLLSQMFSIIAFSLIISNNILIIGINLLLYNILLMLVTKKDIFTKLYNFIPVIITVVAALKLAEQDIMMIFMLILLAINFFILELKKSKMIYSYMFNIMLMTFGIYTGVILNDSLGTDISHLLVFSFVVLLYIIENMLLANNNRENLLNSLTVVTISTMGILHIESFINTNIITPYVISLFQTIILIITHIKSKSIGKNITAILIPIYFIITGIDIINELMFSYHAYIIFAIFTFAVSEFFRKRNRLIHLNAFIISHIFIALTYIIVLVTNFDSFIDDIFYAVLLTGIYVYSYLVGKNAVFKYMSYFTLNFILITLFELFMPQEEFLYYIPMIGTLAIMGLESIYEEIQDKFSCVYLTISKVMSFGFIYASTFWRDSKESIILVMIFATIMVIDNIKNKKQKWNILPLTCVMPVLFLNNLNTKLEMGIMLLSIIATMVMSLKERKISVFTIFSGIYLLCTSLNIENVYLNEILFICWSVIHFLFMTTEPGKDAFKFLSYLSVMFLYNSIISEFELKAYTLFSMLGYVIVAILTLRKILIRYIENIDVFEYLVFGFIYFCALLQYNNEFDGMLFGILLATIVIMSYINKYGALFMVSIFAILVNVFILTREFWFSVPWWLYLLAVGIVLIGFAIRNEISDKKNKINVINILKDIKDKIEK